MENEYKELTLEKLKETLTEFYNGKDTELTIEQLKAKILSGYMYSIEGGTMTLGTGQGGVWLYIDACKDKGLPPYMIQEAISVHIPEKGGSFKLADINVTKINDQH